MGKAKKGRKNRQNEDPSDDETVLDKQEPKNSKKGKKGSKQLENQSEESLSESEVTKTTETSKKVNKKTKQKKVLSDDDEEAPDLLSSKYVDSMESKMHSGKQKVTSKSAFALLDIDDDDDVAEPNSESDNDSKEGSEKNINDVNDNRTENVTSKQEVSEKSTKKSKKKNKKKNEDEEEIEKMLAELELEYHGKKPNEASEKKLEIEKQPDKISDKSAEASEQVVSAIEKGTGETDVKTEESAVINDEDEQTVKSAAQKKKDKKEREKQKKMAQKAQEKTKKQKGDVKPAESTSVAEKDESELKPEEKTEEQQLDEEEETDSKKKKKKKKGEKAEVDDKKKKPGKKQLAAMQEALKDIEREKERVVKEEEAKIKAAEEAEELRLEKLRIEQEKKEKKKQKLKEKRERLKAEGKLLTKAQKQAKARAEATLQALREQGYDVPAIGEKKSRPKYDNKRRPKKKDDTTNDVSSPVIAETDQVEVEIIKNAEVVEKETEKDDSEDVKDAWDVSDDESNANTRDSQTHQRADNNKDVEFEEESSSNSESVSEEGDDDENENDNSEKIALATSERIKETPQERIQRRKEEAEIRKDSSKLRSPVVCVLGHVDTGKTKILDKIRRTHVQDGEAGGITQQIGATMIPVDALKEQCKMVKDFSELDLRIPGLLVIDTPGHESFSNLRSRGSSLCDIAILVVDIMHGLEPQTIESINLLKQRKTPFIIALNKVDRLYDWKQAKSRDVSDTIKAQARNTKLEFEERCKEVILQFAEQGLNAKLFYENADPRKYLSLVPTSAMTGDGMGNLLGLIVNLTQSMLAKQLGFSENLQATVLEVKAIPGLGTTIDVILVNGTLHEGDTMVLAGVEGPVVTQIRSLLMPQPMRELRVKNPYQEFKKIEGAQGVKIAAKELEKTIAGLNLLVAQQSDEVDVLKGEVTEAFTDVMQSIKLADRGVYVQASTLGSLEALLEFLKTSSIPYAGIRIGPVVKRDVMKASIMLEHDNQYAVILAFDVKIERDAHELADSLGVRLFSADIIYHLFDSFMKYRDDLKQRKRDEFKHIAVFPCKLRILPQFIFNSRDPIVIGISIEAGVLKEGTPICVPSKEFIYLGIVTTIEVNHKTIDVARKGQEVCVKIENVPSEAPKLYGRHFDHNDMLVSKITRESIDACKNYFRDDLIKSDWQLMVELKRTFGIL